MAGPVGLHVNGNPDLFPGLLRQHLGDKILQGVQSLALLPDEQTRVVGGDEQVNPVFFLGGAHRSRLLHLQQHLLQDFPGPGQQILLRFLSQSGADSSLLTSQTKKKVRIAIDVEAYRARHNEALALLAQKYGEKVKRSGKSVTLNPMNPYDRRIVHMALQGDKDLKTISRGEGLYKKVVISPVKKKGQEDTGGPA